MTDSPVGGLRVVASEEQVTAIEFSDVPVPTARARARRAAASAGGPVEQSAAATTQRPEGERVDDDPLLLSVVEQLAAYFSRDLKEFDLPLAPRGTAFQQRVWEQLRGIGYGETASYGEIARRLGMTNAASRAVGLANGRNPIPIVIPCHRVIGADGTLTGYAGGLERKQVLLGLEQDALF
jgi:methylated-DNA-[protein]-cysteine S-methyltransferase